MSEEQAEQKEQQKGASPLALDPILLERIKEALQLPFPDQDPFWQMEPVQRREAKRFFGLVKGKDLSTEQLADLRKSAMLSPGSTQVEIAKLKKVYPNHPALMMLSATCAAGALANSGNSKGVLLGLKTASKEAAQGILNNGISVLNVDTFFSIYYNYLSRIKRNQAAVYKQVMHDPRLERDKRKLEKTIRMIDFLIAEKGKNVAIVGHLKKKIKSSRFSTIWDHHDIRQAAKHIENNCPKEECGVATAQEIMAFLHGMLVAFARVPIMSTAVDSILDLIPDSNLTLYLRKKSILTARTLTRYKLASQAQDRAAAAKLGLILLKENQSSIDKIAGQPIKQSYEAEPYFNLATAAQMTMGLYAPAETRKFLENALKSVEQVIKLDMSKAHKYSESASQFTHKINEQLSKLGNAGGDTPPAATKEEKEDSD